MYIMTSVEHPIAFALGLGTDTPERRRQVQRPGLDPRAVFFTGQRDSIPTPFSRFIQEGLNALTSGRMVRTIATMDAAMTDRALENAKSKRNQLIETKRRLLAELAECDEQINQIDKFIKAWHAFAEDDTLRAVENLSESDSNETATTESVSRRTSGNSRKEEVAAAAREIILERGEPIMRDELYDLLTARGLVIRGKDPLMVLSTMLWRMRDQIVRLDSGGYWPADVPNAAIGYAPKEGSGQGGDTRGADAALTGGGDVFE